MTVSGPYEDHRTKHRDGHPDYCITIRRGDFIRTLRYPTRTDATNARTQILNGATR